jgi:hypothetical protein
LAEHYGMPVFPYKDYFVGFLWIFHVPNIRQRKYWGGKLDAQLVYSYNGTHFNRSLREPFLSNDSSPETAGLLNERRLASMKADAVLVNGGRGSLIDQDALCRLLQRGHFWGVGLEVTSPEPLPAAHPLWDQPRVIITPHAAGNSFAPGSALERRIWDFMIENVGAYLRGETPRNQIDFHRGYRRL